MVASVGRLIRRDVAAEREGTGGLMSTSLIGGVSVISGPVLTRANLVLQDRST